MRCCPNHSYSLIGDRLDVASKVIFVDIQRSAFTDLRYTHIGIDLFFHSERFTVQRDLIDRAMQYSPAGA